MKTIKDLTLVLLIMLTLSCSTDGVTENIVTEKINCKITSPNLNDSLIQNSNIPVIVKVSTQSVLANKILLYVDGQAIDSIPGQISFSDTLFTFSWKTPMNIGTHQLNAIIVNKQNLKITSEPIFVKIKRDIPKINFLNIQNNSEYVQNSNIPVIVKVSTQSVLANKILLYVDGQAIDSILGQTSFLDTIFTFSWKTPRVFGWKNIKIKVINKENIQSFSNDLPVFILPIVPMAIGNKWYYYYYEKYNINTINNQQYQVFTIVRDTIIDSIIKKIVEKKCFTINHQPLIALSSEEIWYENNGKFYGNDCFYDITSLDHVTTQAGETTIKNFTLNIFDRIYNVQSRSAGGPMGHSGSWSVYKSVAYNLGVVKKYDYNTGSSYNHALVSAIIDGQYMGDSNSVVSFKKK